MAEEKPPFNPNQPFIAAPNVGVSAPVQDSVKPKFDPNKPFVEANKIDASKGVDPYAVDEKIRGVPEKTEAKKEDDYSFYSDFADQVVSGVKYIWGDGPKNKKVATNKMILDASGDLIPDPNDPENKPREGDLPLPLKIGLVASQYIDRQTLAAIEGAKQLGKGAVNYGLGTQTGNIGLATQGALNAVSGAAKTGFAVGNVVVPQLIAFTAATEAVHALPKEVKESFVDNVLLPIPGTENKNKEEIFDKTIDLPFTMATSISSALGYNPEEESAGKAALEILDLGAIVLAGHAKSIGEKVTKFKDSNELLSSIKKMTDGENVDLELKDYTDFSNKLQNVELSEIKQAAIEKGTPESIDIALKIDDLTPKPVTREEVNRQYREQSDLQSKNAYDAIKNGPESVEALKNTIDASAAIGDITKEQRDKAMLKIDSYEKYSTETKDLALPDDLNRRVHDLAWSNENLKVQSDALNALPDAKIPGSITHIRLAETENMLRENSREMSELMSPNIMDQQSAISRQAETKATEKLEKVSKPKATDTKNPIVPEESEWIVKNLSEIKKKFPGDFEEVFAEARKQYKEFKQSSKVKEVKTEPIKETTVEVEKPIETKEAAKETIEEPVVESKIESKVEIDESEEFVNKKIEELKNSEDAEFDPSLMPIYKQHFKFKYDRQKENTARTGSESGTKNSEVLEGTEAKRTRVAGTPKAKRQLSAKAKESLKIEANSPYDKALQFFINKGEIHPSVIEELYGKASEGEKRARIGLLSKSGKTISEIAHELWEQRPEGDERFTDQDYRNAIEDVLREHSGTRSMMDNLLSKSETKYEMSKEEADYYDSLIEPEFIDEAIDYWDKLSETEKEALALEANVPSEAILAEAQQAIISDRKLTAERIRKGKISGAMSTIDLGITKTVLNTALELAAKEVEKGSKIGEAIEKAVKWIDEQMKGQKWNKKEFVKYATAKEESKSIKPGSTEEYKRAYELSKKRESDIKIELKEAKKDVGSVVSRALAPVSTVLNDIHPVFKKAIRDYQLDFQEGIKKDVNTVKPYLEAKEKMKKSNPEDWANYDFALKNDGKEVIKALTKKYDLEEVDAKRKEVFDQIYEDSKAVGIDLGFKKDYHPRIVKDFEGLMDYINKESVEDYGLIQDLIRMKEAYLERPLTPEEKGQFVSALLLRNEKGISLAGIGNFKIRSIDHITPEMDKYYYDSDTAMLHYITGAREAIARRKLFGKANAETGTLTFGDSLGLEAWNLIKEGKITVEQFNKVQDVLTAYFNKEAGSKAGSMLKNLAYIQTLGNVKAAIANLSDVGVAIYEGGLVSGLTGAAKALVGKSKIKMNEILAEDVIHDFDNDFKVHGVMDTIFKFSGFKHFDKMGKEAQINSIMDKLKSEANKYDNMKPSERLKFKKKVSDWVDADKVDTAIKDLKEGKLTEDTLRLVYNRMLDLNPVGKSEMSEIYLKNAKFRFLYALKSYSLKRFDVYRNDIIKKVKSKDPLVKKEGLKNLVKMATALTISGSTVNVLQNLISGKEVDEEVVFNAMLQLFAANPYLVDKFKHEGPGGVVANFFAPAPITVTGKNVYNLYDDIFGEHKGKSLKMLPWGGPLIYDWTHIEKK